MNTVTEHVTTTEADEQTTKREAAVRTEVLRTACEFVNPKATRGALTGVLIEWHDQHVYIVATDGHTLFAHWERLPDSVQIPDGGVVVPLTAIKESLKGISRDVKCAIIVDGTPGYIAVGERRVYFEPITDAHGFPNWRAMWPRDLKAQGTPMHPWCNWRYLARTQDALARVACVKRTEFDGFPTVVREDEYAEGKFLVTSTDTPDTVIVVMGRRPPGETIPVPILPGAA